MQRSLVSLSLLLAAACGADKTTPASSPAAAVPERPKTTPPAEEPVKPSSAPLRTENDRSKDPAFALKKDGNHNVGFVLDRCPDGFRIADRLRDGEPRLEGDNLYLSLWSGGCPRWTGFAVVPGQGSPLPFYLCEDIQHDPCEMNGTATWVFRIGDALRKNNATAVTYAVPAP